MYVVTYEYTDFVVSERGDIGVALDWMAFGSIVPDYFLGCIIGSISW